MNDKNEVTDINMIDLGLDKEINRIVMDGIRQVTINNMPELPYAVEEAINRLRININFLGSKVRKIMVISSLPDEGKSFVAMQLWAQMAKAGTKSILVDADLRKSVMVDKYDIETSDGSKILGISGHLAGNYELKDVILHSQYEAGDLIPNTDNIVNPSILIEGGQFENMLNTVAEEYRYVFVDSPPLGIVSDGEQIGQMCDGAILVVRGGTTSKQVIRATMQQLERCGCPLLGVVLNRVQGGKGSYYSKGYGKGYGYYGRHYGYGYYGKSYTDQYYGEK